MPRIKGRGLPAPYVTVRHAEDGVTLVFGDHDNYEFWMHVTYTASELQYLIDCQREEEAQAREEQRRMRPGLPGMDD